MFVSGINPGRLWGVRVSLDWSVLVIFLLVTFNLASGVFPAWHPEWGPALHFAVAIGAGVLFVASILAHELAHALVARAYGIPVRRITLFLFGGMADLEEEPASPKQEAVMAGVGPLASFVLGISFLMLSSALTHVSPEVINDPVLVARHMGPVATLLAWLGPMNITLAMFNLIPAFPLDGGRVFRATLWALTGSFETATRWAARLGQGFGWLLIVCGIAMTFGRHVPFLGTGFSAGLWLAFIGWFINWAASASYQKLALKNTLGESTTRRWAER